MGSSGSISPGGPGVWGAQDIAGAQNASNDYAKIAARQERQRQRAITLGTAQINQAYSGFNPQFYQQRTQDYINYAMPQLAQQYRTNAGDVRFGLANKGLLGSSVAARKFSQLNRANVAGERNIADAGLAQAQALQGQVEASRSGAINNLYQSADPAGAGRQAVSTAAGLSSPSIFAPLADMFGSIAQSYYLSSLLNQTRPNNIGSYDTSSGSAGAYPTIPTSTSIGGY